MARENDSNQPPDDAGEEQAEPSDWMPAKQPAWAFALNFFFPGAGLVYLGKALWGLLNFVFVVTTLTIIYLTLAPDVFERLAAGIGLAAQTGSGLLALWLANAQRQAAEHDHPTEC